MDISWLTVLDKLVVVLALMWAGVAVVGWLWMQAHPTAAWWPQRAAAVPPSLDLTDVLLLVGVKEAQLLVLQRELAALQARVESDRAKKGLGDA